MNSRWPMTIILLAFLLGTLCGSLATHLLYCHRFDWIMGGRGEGREEVLVNRLDSMLKLDDRQREQVKVIVHETHQEIMAMRQQIRPQMEALVEKAHVKINAILTPEQRVKFEKMVAERKEKRREKGF